METMEGIATGAQHRVMRCKLTSIIIRYHQLLLVPHIFYFLINQSGNDWCSPEYNTPECSFDGGDCSFYNEYPDCIVPLPSLLGNGKCDAGVYNTPECEFDGGDCLAIKELTLQNCVVDRAELLGDGTCHGGTYNTPECEFDLGDCTQFNNDYPNCNVPFPELIGNGWCSGGEYDVESCGWDGGDCI